MGELFLSLGLGLRLGHYATERAGQLRNALPRGAGHGHEHECARLLVSQHIAHGGHITERVEGLGESRNMRSTVGVGNQIDPVEDDDARPQRERLLIVG